MIKVLKFQNARLEQIVSHHLSGIFSPIDAIASSIVDQLLRSQQLIILQKYV